jgi:hypothetical protein
MLKGLAILAVLGAFLCGWPSMAEQKQGAPHAAEKKTSEQAQPVSPTHVVIDPPLPARSGQPEPTHPQQEPPQNLTPAWRRSEWVIVYVTIAYAIIAWLTLTTIKRQANTMQESAQDDRATAAAASITTADTLAAIKRQGDLMEESSALFISKERARLHVARHANDSSHLTHEYAQGIEERIVDEFNISIVNEGATSAYNTTVYMEVAIIEDGTSKTLFEENILHHIGVIKPGGEEIKGIEIFPGIGQAHLDQLINGEAAFRFSGIVQYVDAFGKDRDTKFEYVWADEDIEVDESLSVHEMQWTQKANEMT